MKITDVQGEFIEGRSIDKVRTDNKELFRFVLDLIKTSHNEIMSYIHEIIDESHKVDSAKMN